MKHTCLIVLLSCALICLVVSQNGKGLKVCCTEFIKTKIPDKVIKCFEKPDPQCPIKNVVIVHTTKDRKLCANSKLKWVKDAMKKFSWSLTASNKPTCRNLS